MNHQTIKKITIVITAIVAVSLISLSTVFLLKNLITKKDSSSTKTASVVLSANDLLKSFKVSGLSNDKYTKLTSVTGLLQYKTGSELYGISLSTNKSIIASTTSPDKSTDTPAIQSQVALYMKDKGLTESNSDIYNSNKSLVYKTFKNDNIICQLMSNDGPILTGQSHSHQLTCVDNKEITDQYNSIKKMLATSNAPKLTASPSQILVITNSKDNIRYSILNFSSKSKQQRLLFAAVDEKWEYLGDLIGGGKQYATGKSSITPELQTKIDNVKYKGFLKEKVADN